MKDKLYKNNHRGIYYRVKGFFFAFALFAGAMAIAVIPTYIFIKDSVKEPTHAEVEKVDEENDPEVEETPIDEANYLSYENN